MLYGHRFWTAQDGSFDFDTAVLLENAFPGVYDLDFTPYDTRKPGVLEDIDLSLVDNPVEVLQALAAPFRGGVFWIRPQEQFEEGAIA